MREQAVYLVFLVVISVANSVGQVLMRWGGNQSVHIATQATLPHPWAWASRWWLLGIILTWICGLGWAWCLRRLPLGTALPVYAGLVYVLSVLGGAYFLEERMSLLQVLGIIAIFVGLVLVTISSVAQPNAQRSR